MTRPVWYVAHALAPTAEQIAADTLSPEPRRAALMANLARAQRWLVWLRRTFPSDTFIAPWIAAVLSGEDDADPAQREAGLVDAEAVAALCTGVVLCGGRISNRMRREANAARATIDLTHFGAEPPTADQQAPRAPFAVWASFLGVLQ